MSRLFQAASTIESISTRKDKTMKLVIGTQELQPDQMAILMENHDKLGWFLFNENAINASDIPKEQAPDFVGQKSPFERLRNILFVYWNTCTDKKIDFELWRRNWVDKKCSEIKELLPKNA